MPRMTWPKLPSLKVLVLAGLVFIITDPSARSSDQTPDAQTCTDSAGTWMPMALDGAPSPRYEHAAVWTGREMLVWGGYAVGPIPLGDGARYDPVLDAWTSMSGAGAPSPRVLPIAIWTGTEMIVWGGRAFVPTPERPQGATEYYTDGARYSPALDRWFPMSADGTPSFVDPAAASFRAMWVHDEMFVFTVDRDPEDPFSSLLMVYRYSPATDSWSTTTPPPQPSLRLGGAPVVWTGEEFIAWGDESLVHTGRTRPGVGIRWNPTTDAWALVTTEGAPTHRHNHVAVWTGTRIIVWGGEDEFVGSDKGDGSAYDPATDRWEPVSLEGAPSERVTQSVVWTGREVVVWGGRRARPEGRTLTLPNDGAAYDPQSDTWRPLPESGLHARTGETVVWDGTEMIIFGGRTADPNAGHRTGPAVNDGARYRPACMPAEYDNPAEGTGQVS
jgi:hypothetical protein